MKKIFFISAFLIIALAVRADFSEPDFAYPQQVVTDAEQQLKIYDKSGDGIGSLQALMQIAVAKRSIDADSMQVVAQRVLQSAAKQKNKQVQSLMHLYVASLINDIYVAKRYVYNERKLPAYPRPADLTEWSGEMFNTVIDSLCRLAWQNSGKMAISDLKRVVSADDDCSKYYPTQADFVASQILSNFTNDTVFTARVRGEIEAAHSKYTAGWYNWQALRLTSKRDVKSLMQLYLDAPIEYRSNASVVFQYIAQIYSSNTDVDGYPTTQFVTDLQQAQATTKGTWAENAVQTLLDRALRPTVRVKMPAYVRANAPFDVKITDMRNVESLIMKVLSGKTVVSSNTIVLNHNTPVSGDTVISMTLPVGEFRINSYLSENDRNFAVNNVQSVSCYPVALSSSDGNYVHVLDASTGASVCGATVSIMQSSKVLSSAVTDNKGMAKFSNTINGYIRVAVDGNTQNFSNIYLRRVSEATTDDDTANAYVSFVTDMPIYMPGDTVRWAGVVTRNSKVLPDKTVNISVVGRIDNNTVHTATATTDSFGRISGSFRLPDDARASAYDINVTDSKFYSSSCFVVSEFNPETIQITDYLVWRDKEKRGEVVVSGKVSDYSGFGIDKATVECVLSDTISVSGVTDVNGKFELTLPCGTTGESETLVTRVVAQNGATASKTQYCPLCPYTLSIADSKSTYDTRNDVTFNVTVKNPANQTVDVPLQWSLTNTDSDSNEAVKSGTFDTSGNKSLNFSDVVAGEYTLRVQLADENYKDCWTYTNFALYNPNRAELPNSSCLWVVNDSIAVNADNTVTLNVGVRDNNTYVYSILGSDSKYAVNKLNAGYHTINIDVSGVTVDKSKLRVYAVRNVDSYTRDYNLDLSTRETLKFNTESFRDKIYSLGTEQWHFTVTDGKGNPVQTAMQLTVFDKRLTELVSMQTQSLYIPSKYTPYDGFTFVSPRSYLGSGSVSKILSQLDYATLSAPTWLYRYALTNGIKLRGRHSSVKLLSAAKYESAAATETTEVFNLADDVTEDYATAVSDAEDSEDEGEEAEDINLRSTTDYLALWLPNLVSDAKGCYDITFNVPDANTTWLLCGNTWTKDGRITSFRHEFVAAKPVMVSVNTPRFVRGDDSAQVGVTVMNNSDVVQNIKVYAYVDADSATVGAVAKQSFAKTLQPGQSEVVYISLDATNAALLKSGEAYVVAKVTNGTFGDGERVRVLVLPSQSLVVNSTNFYLNPGNTSYQFDVPDSAGSNFSCSLTFTENPMWTVVESLPKLTSEDNLTATANSQASAYFSAAVALGLMQQHPELELQFDAANLRKIMTSTQQKLIDLQTTDGSWQWGRWCSVGDLYTTESVLSLFSILKQSGYLPSDKNLDAMLKRAVAYYDSVVKDTNINYVIIRPSFPEVVQSLNGIQVRNATVQSILKNWKSYDVALKARAAIALHRTDNTKMANTLMSSLDQFGTQTASKGFEFMNVRSLTAYAWLLQAYASVTPESEHVDGIRQYLIVRKQATDWGNYPTTSQIVSAMINSGTKWTESADGAIVTVDGTPLDLQANGRMGVLTTELTGRHVSIATSGETPAYGAYIAHYNAPMAEVEAFSDGEISIDKKMYVQRLGKWQNVDSLRVGDKVKISLTVKAKRPFSQLVINDERAATFVPTQQVASWVYAEGVSAYRDNRTAVTDLYINYMPKGTYILEYEVSVNNAGQFASGIATVTCIQAPELTAHSAGSLLTVLPQK